jgi:DNA-directed RNA polymerase specialized sigma24 family protein
MTNTPQVVAQPVAHPLACPKFAKTLRRILVRGGIPVGDADDYVQTVLYKAFKSAAGELDAEKLHALARKIAEDEVIDYRRKRATERKYNVGSTDQSDVAGTLDSPTERAVEAKQEMGCMRQVLVDDGVHPMAPEVAEAHAMGDSPQDIAARLRLAPQTVSNILYKVRQAFARRWNIEKITWGLAWLAIVVIGLPALVSHLHPKRDEANPVRDKQDAPMVSPTDTAAAAATAASQQLRGAEARKDALALCGSGEYLDCLVELDEAKALDPAGDDTPEVREARRAANEALDALENAPQGGKKTYGWGRKP